MPIISKQRFYEHLNPSCQLGPDYALLILCMDLISWLPDPEAHDPRTSTYLTAKKYYLDLEISGVISIQTLQSGILIAIFELGHAIYPSAFLSVASCARHGSALGIGWRTASSGEGSPSWIDMEERNRSWWAIVLLDRIINVGKADQPFLIPNPGLDVILPGRDTDWDQGHPKTLYRVTTPAIEWGDMGPFALVAQATRLLGMVLRHISDPLNLDEEEAILLDRTLKSLSEVMAVEGQIQDLHMMNQKAICTIALILLHEAHATLSKETKTSAHFTAIHYIKTCTSNLAESLATAPKRTDQHKVETCVKDGSPFLVTLLYRGGCVVERLHRENPTPESLENVAILKEVLRIFDTRWKSASTYSRVLEAREMIHKR